MKVSLLVEAIKQVLSYLSPQCNYCGAYYGGPGIPATRQFFFPKITSYYDSRYFCDRHDHTNWKYDDKIKDYWQESYGMEFPPKKFEWQDLPYAVTIRILINSDLEYWNQKYQRFDKLIEEKVKMENDHGCV